MLLVGFNFFESLTNLVKKRRVNMSNTFKVADMFSIMAFAIKPLFLMSLFLKK